MISQKVVPDVYVFGSRMLTRIVRNLYSTLIVTWDRNMVYSVTIILKSLSHPKKLCTTTSGGDILRFGHG
jgi:hypothetical protein